jgi:DNA-binding transcriptional MerR regulator
MKLPPIASALTALELYEPDPDVLYPIDIAAAMARVPRRRIALYYRHGLVSPVLDPECGGWYFNDDAIRELRRIEHLRSTCGMDLRAIGLMLDLLKEVERLREEVRFLRAR